MIKASSLDLLILWPTTSYILSYVRKSFSTIFASLFFFCRWPVCHSLSALLQKLICNLFVLDQKFVLDQVVSQISSVLFNQCSAPLLCVCVCVCGCFHMVGVWWAQSMEQTMLTRRVHLLMTWLKLPSSQLVGGFWPLGQNSLDSRGKHV